MLYIRPVATIATQSGVHRNFSIACCPKAFKRKEVILLQLFSIVTKKTGC